MKLLLHRFTNFQGRLSSISFPSAKSFLHKAFPGSYFQRTTILPGSENHLPGQRISKALKNISGFPFLEKIVQYQKRMMHFLAQIKSIGFTENMDEYDKQKLGIFNLLNFFQLLTGLIVPVAGAFMDNKLSAFSWYISGLPVLISVTALVLNSYRKYNSALISYFLLYPFFTSIVYMGGMNLGTELYFILYGILSVFFIQEIKNMLFSVGLSMISYFILSVIIDSYRYQLQTENIFLYILNQIIAILFIFYGLFLIKKENAIYQAHILAKNFILLDKNEEINLQKKEIAEKADLLEEQTTELTELNTLKNKLFSVIAHDLKSPMYALQTLFRNIQHFDIPAKDIKKMIPDVVNDLNYTTGLMENLLQWAKSQMEISSVNYQKLEVHKVITDITRLLRLQAEAKQISVEICAEENHYVRADKDMLNLILRNLLSNAIKFTPAHGHIIIGAKDKSSKVQLFVQDNGVGINEEAIRKLNENNYYSTRGTASESGTGLGLMLCKEFIIKNGGELRTESIPNQGSVFSFMLNRAGDTD